MWCAWRMSSTTANISAMEPSIYSSSLTRTSWRKVKVTDSRTAVEFAAWMRGLTDVHYPKAERIRVLPDNLSTRLAGALYEAFLACEARRVPERLEFYYVPKHASWLSMVEIEIGVLQSLDHGSALASASKPKSSPGNDGEMQHAPVSFISRAACHRHGSHKNWPRLYIYLVGP